MMAKIIEFPNKPKKFARPIDDATKLKSNLIIWKVIAKIFRVTIDFIWVVAVLLFPILSWIIALDCVVQFIRMMYYWHDKNVPAGITFILHFAVLTSLYVFTFLYKPKDN